MRCLSVDTILAMSIVLLFYFLVRQEEILATRNKNAWRTSNYV